MSSANAGSGSPKASSAISTQLGIVLMLPSRKKYESAHLSNVRPGLNGRKALAPVAPFQVRRIAPMASRASTYANWVGL